MTSQELFAAVKRELNRPADDDLFADDDIWTALVNAEAQIAGEVAEHHPDVLAAEELLTPTTTSGTDAYRWYNLSEYAAPGLEVWEPPGRNKGCRVYPKDAGLYREGYILTGKRLELDPPRAYSPGLYVYWSKLKGQVSATAEPLLPAFLHEYLSLKAAAKLARRPHSLIDHIAIAERATALWEGDPLQLSDTGILGRLKRMSAHYGVSHLDSADVPWWRGMR